MPAFRSAALIVNVQSRRGQAMFDEAQAQLARLACPLDAHAVTDPERLAATLAAALERKPDLVVLGGGDGTISGLVDGLAGSGAALGVLPLGTANSFARALGIPLDLEGAVDTIVTGERRRIDLGRIDGDYFANCASIGLAPLIAQSVPAWIKRWFGRAGYLAWAAIRFARFRPFTLIVGEGAAARRLRVVEVRIANGGFHGGTELVEEAALDSGEIVVQAVRGKARRRLLRNWGAAALGLRAHRDDEVSFRGQSLRIATDPPLPVSIDGEVLARTPVTARIAPAAIDVVVPKPA